jgi:ribosomal protein S18 acetylase RimI-like enzyme
MIIRNANISDVNDIFLCSKECLPIYYSVDEYKSFVQSKNEIIIIAKDHIGLCGYVYAKIIKQYIHIMSFGIYDRCRRKGIGSLLIDHLVDWIKIDCVGSDTDSLKSLYHKISAISLYVHAENIGGIKFYKNYGFKQVKVLSNYYGGYIKDASTQDAFRLEKIIL